MKNATYEVTILTTTFGEKMRTNNWNLDLLIKE